MNHLRHLLPIEVSGTGVVTFKPVATRRNIARAKGLLGDLRATREWFRMRGYGMSPAYRVRYLMEKGRG